MSSDGDASNILRLPSTSPSVLVNEGSNREPETNEPRERNSSGLAGDAEGGRERSADCDASSCSCSAGWQTGGGGGSLESGLTKPSSPLPQSPQSRARGLSRVSEISVQDPSFVTSSATSTACVEASSMKAGRSDTAASSNGARLEPRNGRTGSCDDPEACRSSLVSAHV